MLKQYHGNVAIFFSVSSVMSLLPFQMMLSIPDLDGFELVGNKWKRGFWKKVNESPKLFFDEKCLELEFWNSLKVIFHLLKKASALILSF